MKNWFLRGVLLRFLDLLRWFVLRKFPKDEPKPPKPSPETEEILNPQDTM